MKLLVVFAHPLRNSYPRAVLDAFLEPIRAQGHQIDLLDLHEEDFDPRFTQADHAHFWGGDIPEEISAYQKRMDAADRLAFIYPVYWWGMPAIMKGWIERTFSGDWAYVYGEGVEDRGKAGLKGLLANRPTLLLGIGGSTERTYRRYRYDDAMRTAIDVGVFSYCGIRDVETHLLFDVEGDANADRREAYLDDVKQVARAFIAPDRVPRDAKAEHFAD